MTAAPGMDGAARESADRGRKKPVITEHMSYSNSNIPPLQNSGYRTDLIFPAFEGIIEDRGDYIVIRTPKNPGYYWGNYLLFRDAPAEGDLERWMALFKEEIAAHQRADHVVFGWDSSDAGAIEQFYDAGFKGDNVVVMKAAHLDSSGNRPPPYEIRPLTTDAEWSGAIENQVLCRDMVHEESGYRRFRAKDMDRYRRMAEAGLGAWFGAFDGDRVVGDLGLFGLDDLARYQSVETHPYYRRRGIARSLVVAAAEWSRTERNTERFVIAAEPDSVAEKIYRSLGFRGGEMEWGVEKW